MRLNSCYAPTLKEAPADAEVVSHKLLIRAGCVRKLTSGIYTFLPLGLRALRKVEAIVREEMDRAGAQEIAMPMVQPGDLWKETGRWEFYGKELLRFTDRHERDYCLGPTHEEVVTDLLRGEVRSYRQLPVNLYQIQSKFRDEIRPRFGLMRGREFLMKDAYSFDRDEAGADASYKAMYDAYARIFTRTGMRFRAVAADSGAIGGSYSHEFMVLADTGEDTIAVCTACDYAANLEKAAVVVEPGEPATDGPAYEVVATPGAHTVAEVAAFLKVPDTTVIKTLLYEAEIDGKQEVVAVLLRGDRELNEIKLTNLLGAASVTLADAKTVTDVSGAPVGFAGPVGLGVEKIFADLELSHIGPCVAGANQADAHMTGVLLGRDAKVTGYHDLRTVTETDPCPVCGGKLALPKGIEVGHVFKLGTKYSEAMNLSVLDENGKDQLVIMGCYGIGVSRILAACIEQNNDEGGIIWPPAVAPYQCALLNLDPKKDEVNAVAEAIEADLASLGVDVLHDDRDERPGFKFKDADLMGLPFQLVVGGKGVAKGIVEAKDRRTGEKTELDLATFKDAFSAWREQVLAGWTAYVGEL